jgi:hypothetical protein
LIAEITYILQLNTNHSLYYHVEFYSLFLSNIDIAQNLAIILVNQKYPVDYSAGKEAAA